MATIAKLVSDGELVEIVPDLDPGVCPARYLYALPRFTEFLDALPSLISSWNLEQTPAQQFDDLLNEFLGTEPFTVDLRFKPLRPLSDPWHGIWELKTPDIRIFGWFAERNKFIAVSGLETWKVKEHRLYAGCRDEVIRVRNNLALDEPKFVTGKDYHDVISLLAFP